MMSHSTRPGSHTKTRSSIGPTLEGGSTRLTWGIKNCRVTSGTLRGCRHLIRTKGIVGKHREWTTHFHPIRCEYDWRMFQICSCSAGGRD
eukprot:s1628_g8.t1